MVCFQRSFLQQRLVLSVKSAAVSCSPRELQLQVHVHALRSSFGHGRQACMPSESDGESHPLANMTFLETWRSAQIMLNLGQ
jgi:hypothetical protein